ncbi:hypothetical protein LTR50_007815 [Elasticomyces elasticus]|nr:hypothetical protein LTR50_007815 [Elasticomyces elasticus]
MDIHDSPEESRADALGRPRKRQRLETENVSFVGGSELSASLSGGSMSEGSSEDEHEHAHNGDSKASSREEGEVSSDVDSPEVVGLEHYSEPVKASTIQASDLQDPPIASATYGMNGNGRSYGLDGAADDDVEMDMSPERANRGSLVDLDRRVHANQHYTIDLTQDDDPPGFHLLQNNSAHQQQIPLVQTRVRVSQLTPHEQALQARYFGAASPDELVHCVICSAVGHMPEMCPAQTCEHCAAVNSHVSRACPKVIRCVQCKQPGHVLKDCQQNLHMVPVERIDPCDWCHKQGHEEKDCTELWRTYDPSKDPNVIKLRRKKDTSKSVWSREYANHFHSRPIARGSSHSSNGWNLIGGRNGDSRVISIESDDDDDDDNDDDDQEGASRRFQPISSYGGNEPNTIRPDGVYERFNSDVNHGGYAGPNGIPRDYYHNFGGRSSVPNGSTPRRARGNNMRSGGGRGGGGRGGGGNARVRRGGYRAQR